MASNEMDTPPILFVGVVALPQIGSLTVADGDSEGTLVGLEGVVLDIARVFDGPDVGGDETRSEGLTDVTVVGSVDGSALG